MRTFGIVCRELPERAQVFRDQFHGFPWPATIWEAAHGTTWGLETRLEYEPGKHLPSGHVSLNVSTWFLWQYALQAFPGDAPDEVYLFLEDDAVIPQNFPAILVDLLIQLQYDFTDWDLVFLGLAEREPHVWHKVTERIGKPNSRLCRMNDPFGTHAYIIRRRVLPVLLEHMRAAERNLDQQLWQRVLSKGLLKWCAILPSIVTQRTYDYLGTDKPEWKPSCIESESVEVPPTMAETDVQEVQKLIGYSSVDLPGRPSAPTIEATNKLVDPFPCIYRGEYVPVDGTGTLDGRPKRTPLSQCAALRVLCYARPGVKDVVADNGRDVTACETCTKRQGMEVVRDRSRLPIPDGHFNPSMIEWGGKLILATRDSWGHSKVALWELTNSKTDWLGTWKASPIGSFASPHPDAPRLEDPRLFLMPDPDTGRDTLCAQFNLPDGYPPKRVNVGYVRFARDLSGITHTEVMRSPHNNLYEKNWVPFWDGNELRWVYSTKPEHLVLGQTSAWKTPNNLPWTGGVIRGGAAPVFVHHPKSPRGVYYHFFHGCLKRVQGSVYTMGCTVFEANPPFQVLSQTPTPLLWPDLPVAGEDVVKRYVLWPGGAVLHKDRWFFALGIDDSFSRIDSISVDDVEMSLTDIPEYPDETGLGIRDTHIASGVTVDDL